MTKYAVFPVFFFPQLSASRAYHECTCASVHLIFLFLSFKRKKRYLVISASLLNSLYHSFSIYLPTKICLFVCLAFSTLFPFQLPIIMMKQIPVMQEALTEHLTQRSVTLRHSLLRSCAHRVLPSFLFFFFSSPHSSRVSRTRGGGGQRRKLYFSKREIRGVNVSSRAKKKKKRKRVSLPFLAVTEVPVVLSRAVHIPRL